MISALDWGSSDLCEGPVLLGSRRKKYFADVFVAH